MNKEQKEKRNWLIDKSKEYHESKPTASDTDWDKEFYTYTTQYPEDIEIHNLIMDNSMNDRVEPLPIPMFSLNKIKNINTLIEWIRGIHNKYGNQRFVFTAKFDGLAITSEDKKGQAWTRGDGTEGMRSHDQYRSMKLPFFTDIDGIDFTYGEVLPTRKAFTTLISPEPYANGRSFASSMFRTDTVKTEEIKSLTYMRYGVGGEVGESMDKMTQLFTLDKLNIVKMTELSNPMAIHVMSEEIIAYSPEDLLARLDAIYKHFNKTFECDGVVVDVDDAKIRRKLGRNNKNNPNYAKAFKLVKWNEQKDTKITGYDFNISKQGLLKGTVTFTPVMIGGTEIKQATFYNASFISDFCLVPGANITIIQSGMVIPKIIAVEGIEIPAIENYPKNRSGFEIALQKASEAIQAIHGFDAVEELMVCPSCGHHLTWNSTMVDLVCSNEGCSGIKESKLFYFTEKIEIDGVSDISVKNFYERGYETPEQLFHIRRKDINIHPGWGDLFANKTVSQFEKIKEDGLPLAKWLKALDLTEGIVGEENIQKMLNHLINNMGYDFQESPVSSNFIEGLQTIEGVAHRSASSFVVALEAFINNYDWCKVSYYTEEEPEQLSNELDGEAICFSGCRLTDAEKSIVVAMGGKVVSGVSSKTTVLVVKDVSNNVMSKSKPQKAVDLGIEILTIDDFKNKYNV